MTDPLFWELHEGLARQGPGSRADTLKALALTGLGGRLRVLDVGSGPGAASLVLLEALPEAEVTAVDLHPPFLDDAARAAAGYGERFRTLVADMGALPFAPGSFELIWCEGAAYSIGVAEALAAWRPLLAAGGRLAFSDAVWLTGAPHERARTFWAEYPAMTDVAGVRGRIAAAGWRCLGDFVLSDAAWENYYGPLGERLAVLSAEHGDAPALRAAAEEIAVRRGHGRDYGYAFFVAAP